MAEITDGNGEKMSLGNKALMWASFFALFLLSFTIYSVAYGVTPTSGEDVWAEFSVTTTSNVSSNYLGVVLDTGASGCASNVEGDNGFITGGEAGAITLNAGTYTFAQITALDSGFNGVGAPTNTDLCFIYYSGGWQVDSSTPFQIYEDVSTPTPTPSFAPVSTASFGALSADASIAVVYNGLILFWLVFFGIVFYFRTWIRSL